MKTGIVKNANEAKSSAQAVGERDKIEAEIINSYDKRGILQFNTVMANLNHIENVTVNGSGNDFPITVSFTNGNSYSINENGDVSLITQ